MRPPRTLTTRFATINSETVLQHLIGLGLGLEAYPAVRRWRSASLSISCASAIARFASLRRVRAEAAEAWLQLQSHCGLVLVWWPRPFPERQSGPAEAVRRTVVRVRPAQPPRRGCRRCAGSRGERSNLS